MVKDFSWEPYPSESGITLGLPMLAVFSFNIQSTNSSTDISDLFTSKSRFSKTFQAYTSIDPLLSVLDDVKIEYVEDGVNKVNYTSKTR